MTNKEAQDFLSWYKKTVNKYHFLARFKSTRPFHVDYPGAGEKARKAKITLGIHEFQKSYSDLIKVYPYLTKDRYNKQRIKLQIKKIKKMDEFKKIKKNLNLTDSDIAKMFGYKNANVFRNSSRKKHIENGIVEIEKKIKKNN